MDQARHDTLVRQLARRRREALAALWQIEALAAGETRLIEGDATRIKHRRRERLKYLSDCYRAELAEIEQVSERIQQRIYGNCRSCGGEIHLRLVGVVPKSELCGNCQAVADRAARMAHRSEVEANS